MNKLLFNDIEDIKQLVLMELRTDLSSSKYIDPSEIKLPMPYPGKSGNLKAIVLGADPTHPHPEKELKYVFGLENEKSPYFTSILFNLNFLGLGLENIYVQNLCPNYFKKVTDENDGYINIAEKYWLPVIKMELDSQFSPDIPVFVTAWKPLIAIAHEAAQYQNNKISIYENVVIFMKNKLDRPVIALFRGGWRKGFNGYYDLRYHTFKRYVSAIQEILYH
jgi:hypothetical protein